jgi:hypothetical protein
MAIYKKALQAQRRIDTLIAWAPMSVEMFYKGARLR